MGFDMFFEFGCIISSELLDFCFMELNINYFFMDLELSDFAHFSAS